MPKWYLWAVNDDPDTNKYFVEVIGKQNLECTHDGKKCTDGKRRNLFECPRGYADVQRAIAAIPEFNLKVEVFQEEHEDSVVRYDLWKVHVRRRALHANLGRGVHRGSSM
ncbi:MAG: hypothetical protein AAB805_00605 [Patescibacteria group bacterium]